MNFWLQDLSREVQLFIRGRPRQRESVYAYDTESRLKWEFVLEFHLIDC